jgi:5'-3' exonuclease
VPTVHLVDASPYIFRAYFSLPDTLVGPDGSPVNAVRGFLDFLIRLVQDEEVTHLGLAFDRSLTTSFRNDLYPEYKAQRALPPAELEAQLDACEEAARAFGAPTWWDERYEADDYLATLTVQLPCDVVVVSSDKDLAQLVNEHVTLLDYAKGTRYGPAEVEAKFGVRPEQIPDYLGLAGDSVDNIPGVKGVGAKTAAALLRAFPDIDALYACLDAVEGLPLRGAKSIRGKLETERDMAFLSRQLATAATDAPAHADLAALRWDGAVAERIDPLFERLGLEGIRGRIPKWR